MVRHRPQKGEGFFFRNLRLIKKNANYKTFKNIIIDILMLFFSEQWEIIKTGKYTLKFFLSRLGGVVHVI